MEVDVAGSPVDAGTAAPGSDGGTSGSAYVSVRRLWEGTTVVTVRLEMELHAELLPDGSPWVSFLYGPVEPHGPGTTASPVVAGPEPLDAVVLRDRSAIIAEFTAVDADGSVHLVGSRRPGDPAVRPGPEDRMIRQNHSPLLT